MWACWHNDTIYDPARHGTERRLAAERLKKLKRYIAREIYRDITAAVLS